MTIETDSFLIADATFNYIESRERNSNRMASAQVKGGLKSARVTCKGCSFTWTSHQFGQGKFSPALGYVLFDCPSCSAHGSVANNLLV